MFSIISKYLNNILISITSLFVVYLWNRNKRLIEQNELSKVDIHSKDKTITIQNKVLDVVQNTPDGDLVINIKRMRDDCYNKALPVINLPEMPIAGKEVAEELSVVCNNTNCKHLNDWLNKLYVFRKKYLIYKEELSIN